MINASRACLPFTQPRSRRSADCRHAMAPLVVGVVFANAATTAAQSVPSAAAAPPTPPAIVRMAPPDAGGRPADDVRFAASIAARVAAARARAVVNRQSAERALQQGRLVEAADLLHSAVASDPDDAG